jgi:hypothetical protein
LQFVSGVTPLWLLNHLLRTYVFAELLGRRSAMKYGSELLYLGAIMHDLGLTVEFSGRLFGSPATLERSNTPCERH